MGTTNRHSGASRQGLSGLRALASFVSGGLNVLLTGGTADHREPRSEVPSRRLVEQVVRQDVPLVDNLCKVLVRENQFVDHRRDIGLLLPGNALYKGHRFLIKVHGKADL
ncbi:protein of unknown function [Candidatus Methylomirabilis oxygeniifera]|uniref:Uncharacterized protein n=1 Tax=Methylomirabilis oxygeniifera TaxID=671143 RepID=D5MJ11_METO1|nr:protein of unknown function [Candidatus Methylomirabilis oxyfera]